MESLSCNNFKLSIIVLLFLRVFAFSLGKSNSKNESDEPLVTEWGFSPVALLNLAKIEVKFYKTAVKMRKTLKDKLDAVDKWIEDYEQASSSKLAPEAKSDISDHPLMAFRMIRRFSHDLVDILHYISENISDTRFIQKMNGFEHPKPLDVLHTADKILLLQVVHDITAEQMRRGKLIRELTPVGLTIPQAYEIGKRGLDTKIWPQAFDWLLMTLRLIKKKAKGSELVDKSEVRRNIRRLIEEHDAMHDSIMSGEETFYQENMNRFRTQINYVFGKTMSLKLETEKEAHIREQLDLHYELPMYFAFMLLCDGDNFQTERLKSKLFCYYETTSDPFWKMNPLKIEVHSWDPYLIQIYDVIGNSRIEFLKTEAIPSMIRSQVVGDEDDATVDSDSFPVEINQGRTSVQTFLSDSDNHTVENLSQLIGKMVGLEVVNREYEPSSEDYQIAAYSFGGYYGEHLDALNLTGLDGGERIATFMIYLNDVKLGGSTAFPYIGTSIAPVKGSAVFWYNLMKNGEIDTRTLHGGCPVILGEKWIANKWILHNANFQKRKCALYFEE